MTSAANATAPAVAPRARSGPLAEEQQLLGESHVTGDVHRSKHGQERKRRCRPEFATSAAAERHPTSAPYSGSQGKRAGARTRQKALGESYLQKTAVLNSTTAQNMAAMQEDQTPLELKSMVPGDNSYRAKLDMSSDGTRRGGYAPMISDGIPRQRSSATTPDLLNYDVLDHENGPSVPYIDEATGDEMVYSDFSTIDPDQPIPDDNDFFDPFQGNDDEPLPISDSDDAAQGLIWQNKYDDASGLHHMPR